MPKYYETDEFKKLDAQWQSKLKKKGFDDIEQPDGNLKTWSVSQKWKYLRDNPEIFHAKQTYFMIAGQFLHEHKFSSAFEKDIWKNHVDGMTVRDIAIKLSHRKGAVKKTSVHMVIKRLAAIMKKAYLENKKDHTGEGTWLSPTSTKKTS